VCSRASGRKVEVANIDRLLAKGGIKRLGCYLPLGRFEINRAGRNIIYHYE
jgi:hypothetical protein